MGILRHHLDILFTETSKNNFIKGEVLCLGQQAVYLTLDQVYKLAAKHKDLKLSNLPENFDSKNKIPSWVGTKLDSNTNVQTIFKLLGAEKVSIADISDYESPDLLINLNDSIDSSFFNKFDVIFDCGTLEHVFDFPTALWNLISMLKNDGVLYLAVPSSNSIDHGFYSFSPGLFFDYFDVNGLEVMGCYLREGSPLFYQKTGKLYKYKGLGSEIPIISSASIEVIIMAKKTKSLVSATKPIQTVYKNKFSNETSEYSSKKKKLLTFAYKILTLLQNLLPKQFEILIAKLKNKIGRNNITFIKRI